MYQAKLFEVDINRIHLELETPLLFFFFMVLRTGRLRLLISWGTFERLVVMVAYAVSRTPGPVPQM